MTPPPRDEGRVQKEEERPGGWPSTRTLGPYKKKEEEKETQKDGWREGSPWGHGNRKDARKEKVRIRRGKEEERARSRRRTERGARRRDRLGTRVPPVRSSRGRRGAPVRSAQELAPVGRGVGGLSISQCGALLAVAAFRSGTPLGSYLSRALVPGSSSGQRNRRQRSLLPLPLWDDSVTELKKLQEEGEFRRLAGSWAEKKMSKDKAGRLSRKVGLLVWHGLTVTVLNFLWTGGGGKGEVGAGPPGKAQSQALDRIWELVKVFVDDNSESTSKVPRSPEMGEWGKKLGDVRVSYHGEVVEKAQRLTLDQILPGLPPMGYGASVALAELCEGEVREKLENPLSTLLPEDELPDDVPAPKVHASQEQWEKIAGELYRRGLVQPVEDPVKVKGQAILNGAFGVPKPGKFLEDERAILRLIMDFRAVKLSDGDCGWGRPKLGRSPLPSTCGVTSGEGDPDVSWRPCGSFLSVPTSSWVEPADVLCQQGGLEMLGDWPRWSSLCGGHRAADGMVECGRHPTACSPSIGATIAVGRRWWTAGTYWDPAWLHLPGPGAGRGDVVTVHWWCEHHGSDGRQDSQGNGRKRAARSRSGSVWPISIGESP